MRFYLQCFSIFLLLVVFSFSCKNNEKTEIEKTEKVEKSKREYTERTFTFDSFDSASNEEIKPKPPVKKEIKEKAPTQDISKKKIIPKKKAVKKKKQKVSKGKLKFLSDEYDFGFIEVGEIVDHTFKFVNTGKKPVNISNAVASCGCTTPVFPFLPIEPGESGQIQVRFNSKDRLGGQVATVTVYSDAENNIQELKIKGVIRSEIVSPAEFVDTIK